MKLVLALLILTAFLIPLIGLGILFAASGFGLRQQGASKADPKRQREEDLNEGTPAVDSWLPL